MRHPQKKKNITTLDSKYTYPYRNESLSDMEGEIWKDLKGFEGSYLVSNLGRVKRLKTFRIITGPYGNPIKQPLPERIVTQHVKYRFNRHLKQNICAGVGLTIQRGEVRIHVHSSRLVYETFIGKIPEKGIIQHKDNDPQNNRVENLYLSTRRDLTYKLYNEGRSNMLYSVLGVKHSAERIAKHVASRSKEVSQYDLDGNWVATYPSLKEAERKTKISHTSISSVLSGKNYVAKGFVWRTEKKAWIDLSSFKQKRFESRANNTRAVCQYTLDGKLIATYKSLSEVSRVLGISHRYLYVCIKNNKIPIKSEYRYIWKYKDEDKLK